MIGIVAVVGVVVLLGAGFMAIRASKRPTLQRRGPWLFGASACMIATVVVSTFDRDLTSLLEPSSRQQINDILLTAVVMAILASEAVLISRWAMSTRGNKTTHLAIFSCTTLVAWFLTFLVLSSVVPGS
jgi:hypothetical protein